MEKTFVVALLLEKYQRENEIEIIPEDFELLELDEKIMLLNKALKEHISLEELI